MARASFEKSALPAELFPRFLLAPYRLCAVAAVLIAVLAGAACPLLRGLPLQLQAIVTISIVGLGALLVIPSRRLALVCAWVLAFPLSLEKVYFVVHPAFRGFFIAPITISGADLMLGMLVLALVAESLIRQRSVVFWDSTATPFLLLVGWVGVSAVLNPLTGEGILQILHWIKMAIFLLVMTSAIRNREELLTVVVAVAVAVLVQSVLVGIAYTFKRHIGFSPRALQSQLLEISTGSSTIVRATGTVGHPNQQAMFQTLFTIPIFALLMARNWLWRVFAGAVLIASGCGIIVTLSRTAWISCSVAGAVIFVLAFRNHRITRRMWLGLCLGSLAAIVLLGAFSGLILTRLTKADDGASASRIHLALQAIEHVSNRPITGVGPGNFVNAKLATSQEANWARSVWLPRGVNFKARYIDNLELGLVELLGHWYYTSLPAHNKYLLVAAELGLVGLALFLWFQWRLLRAMLSGLSSSDPLLWWVGAALVGTFAASLIEYMLELFYDDKTVLMPLFANVLMICFARVAADRTPREVGT